MKKVFLYAYDRINLGDDLFIHEITKRYPHVKFYMMSDKKNKNTFKALRNLTVLDKESLFIKTIRWLRPSFVPKYIGWRERLCNAVVYIGGSIFIEYDNWEQILTWWDYEAKKNPFYVLGANFGPYKTKAYRDKLAGVLKHMKDVCFRDQYSFNMFSNVSVVRNAPDILFNYSMPLDTTTQKQIFVSVIDCGSRKSGLGCLAQFEEQYLELLRCFLNNYLQDGYTLVFVSFCRDEGDETAIDNVLAVMNIAKENCKIKILAYDGTNAETLIRALAESELIVASRFHALILGFVANKPVLPLVYSDKTLYVLEDVGFKGKIVDIRNIQEVDFAHFHTNLESQKLQNVSALKEQAKMHFAKLDEILLGERSEY